MTDRHSQESRSNNMARIRAKDTKPEMLVRKYLFSKGFRYRIHDRRLPGKPDIVLPKYRVVVHVHGCFWHSHKGCRLNRLPSSRPEYWIPKLEGNALRDEENRARLEALGWRVLTIWECGLKNSIREEILSALIHGIKHSC